MPVKILIIEDEMLIRGLLVQTIELSFDQTIDNEEMEILEACNGEEGVEIANKERPGLIFTDIMMPKMNGYHVCKSIKENPDLKETYIILLTAKGQEIDKEKGRLIGADEYITKPFDPEKIILKIEEILKIKRNDQKKSVDILP